MHIPSAKYTKYTILGILIYFFEPNGLKESFYCLSIFLPLEFTAFFNIFFDITAYRVCLTATILKSVDLIDSESVFD